MADCSVSAWMYMVYDWMIWTFVSLIIEYHSEEVLCYTLTISSHITLFCDLVGIHTFPKEIQ